MKKYYRDVDSSSYPTWIFFEAKTSYEQKRPCTSHYFNYANPINQEYYNVVMHHKKSKLAYTNLFLISQLRINPHLKAILY